ncbi:hypothetical protein VCHA50P415_260025 [Vibrio chagasii]|nr:hypothetical protein VCHA50P415_260025 [Vibrio chagasii]
MIKVGLRSESRNLKVGTGKSQAFALCSAVLEVIPKNSWLTCFSSTVGFSNLASSANFVFIVPPCSTLEVIRGNLNIPQTSLIISWGIIEDLISISNPKCTRRFFNGNF